MNILLMAVMMGLAMFAFHGHGHHHSAPEPQQQAPYQKGDGTPLSPARNPPQQPSVAQREANVDSKFNAGSKPDPMVD